MKTVSARYQCLFLIFGFFLLCPASFLRAQDGDESEGDRITAIHITGLKRTRFSTAERYLKKFIDIEADKLDTNEVWAAIMDTGILEPVSVEVGKTEAGEKVLAVEVREKWSIFPIPVFIAGSGGMTFGGALFDGNVFGLNDKFFLAGIYYSEGWLASAGYIHASPGGRVPGWNAIGLFSREERYDRNQRNRALRRFDLDTFSFRLGLDSSLLGDSDLLSVSAHVSYDQKILKDQGAAMNGPHEGLHLFGAGAGPSLRRSSWDGYFLSQEEASLQYSFHISTDGFFYQSVNFRGIWEKSLVPGFRLNIRTGLVFDPDVPVLFESSPSAAQVAILPMSFSARHYAGASAGLEKYLFRNSIGTFSVSAAYQVVYSQGSVLGDSLDHGVVGMFSFFLSKLAIPAFGLGASYNVKEEYFQFSFSIGMSL